MADEKITEEESEKATEKETKKGSKKETEKTASVSVMETLNGGFGSFKEHTIDAKNRLFIPAKMRNKLGSTFRVFCPIDGSECLYIYSNEEWGKIAESVMESQDFAMQRLFFGGMVETEPDKQGRITLPPEFCEFAGLKKNVIVAGVGKRLEIWDADKYRKTMTVARNSRNSFDFSHIKF